MKTKAIKINGALSTPVLVFGKPKTNVKPLHFGIDQVMKVYKETGQIPVEAKVNYKEAAILGVKETAQMINNDNISPHYGWGQIQQEIHKQYMSNPKTNYDFSIEVDNLEIRFCRMSEVRYILQDHFTNYEDEYILGSYSANLLSKVLFPMGKEAIKELQKQDRSQEIGEAIVKGNLQEKMANTLIDDYGIEEVCHIFAHYDGRVNRCVIDGYDFFFFYLNR